MLIIVEIIRTRCSIAILQSKKSLQTEMSAREGIETGSMSNDGFDLKILSEKLSKLNNSQRSIDSLSRLCISNRKKARQIVETWEEMFNSSQKQQHVSYLYLANDILQNSRRKGIEFVNEFCKVLPTALKHVYANGDESGKKAATRLVDIWEDRNVLGSHVQTLKDELATFHKLAVGGMCQKIVSAFHNLCSNDDYMLKKCNTAAHSLERIVKNVEKSISQGIQPGTGVAEEMLEHEIVLQQCVKQLEGAEASRTSLISLLNEVLKDQELRLETLRCQLQIALTRINEVQLLKLKLSSHDYSASATPIPSLTEPQMTGELNNPGLVATSQQPQIVGNQQIPAVPQVSHNPTSFAALTPLSHEDNKKAAAAAVAAKLSASTSSAQMLASALESFVAEEAASMNDSLGKVGFSSSLPIFPPEKRQKLEQPLCSGTDPADIIGGSSPSFTLLQQPISSNQVLQSSMQVSLSPPLHPSPPPSLLPMNLAPNQFSQSADMMLNMMPPSGYASSCLPPPPLTSHVAIGLARPLVSPQSSQVLQPLQQLCQQQNASGEFYRPPDIRRCGPTSQPSTPPVPQK